MEQTEIELTERAIKLLRDKPSNQRVLIGLAGSPGSGKSTMSSNVTDRINKKFGEEISIVLDQDGYHYTREELSKFPDPELAFKRRGAPFTFNPKGFLDLIHELQKPITTESKDILAPSFNHKKKDPEPNSRRITPQHRIIIIEGNYVLLRDEYWKEISKIVDEKWKIKVDPINARRRIIKRHLEAGISASEEEAIERCDNNDMVNAVYISENSVEPDLIIDSIDEIQG
ncbi:hypothetical protein WICPIJ_001193 [Wickerhamomyces pijperi]|uniref:Phosphoribulokinase/uridine kinase domain-containing protein n=1 Tax=Wickerhamomyces pijperi TaxID=599730 RepID=A0A9P8QBD3_WICPI|nr:hypothetical protein WICPIJ_001193 [Wickerhamomyces pijperi]